MILLSQLRDNGLGKGLPGRRHLDDGGVEAEALEPSLILAPRHKDPRCSGVVS